MVSAADFWGRRVTCSFFLGIINVWWLVFPVVVVLPYGMTDGASGRPLKKSHGMSRPLSWDGGPDLAVPEGAVD
ncbi:hypothetical protein HDV64DRAFT_90157 [Trichoderma sp. TUCIM 5745]